jgi:NNP family nitrate/nitrite transporter-like MFS transporter
VASTIWVFLGRNAPKGVTIIIPSVIIGIKRGLGSKNVWLIAFGQFLFLGAFIGLFGNLPIALEKVHHVDPKTAGAIASLLTWGVTLGNFLIPMISDKVGLRKIFVYSGALVSAMCFFIAWYLAPGTATGVFIFAGGIIFGGIQPVLFAILVELPEIGLECLGGTSGIVATFLNAGGFFIPLLVVSPLLAPGTIKAYTTGFLAISLIIAAIAVLTIFLYEPFPRGKRLSG